MRKGQIEFVLLIGIVLLAAVVIYFALGVPAQPNVPEAILDEQNMVSDYTLNFLREMAEDVVKDVETHGGYFTLVDTRKVKQLTSFTTYAGVSVPYWQRCDQDISPGISDIKNSLEAGLEEYVKENIVNAEQDFYGKDVVFEEGKIDVKANIVDSKIDFEVSLPTKVEGYYVKQPYKFSYPTTLGRIVSFAKDFSKDASERRFFELFAINSIYFSREWGDGEHALPTITILLKCGQVVYRSPLEVSTELQNIVRYVVSSTEWWQKISTEPSQPRAYGIDTVNGKTYKDLEISLKVPDDIGIRVLNPVLIVNNNPLIKPFSNKKFIRKLKITECLLAYNQVYRFGFPIILSVRDKVTGNSFYLASYSYVSDGVDGNPAMMPAKCNAPMDTPVNETFCQNADYPVHIEVADSQGNYIDGVAGVFDGCYIGSSVDGVIESNIPRSRGFLILSHPDFGPFLKNVSYYDVSRPYWLYKVPEVLIHFRKMRIERLDSYDKCISEQITDPKEVLIISMNNTDTDMDHTITNIDYENYQLPDNIEDCETDPMKCADFNVVESNTVGYVNGGDYVVDAEINILDYSYRVTHAFQLHYNYPEVNSELHVYVPESVDEPSDYEKSKNAYNVKDICGVDVISSAALPPVLYNIRSCNCDTLYAVSMELNGDCLVTEDLREMFTMLGGEPLCKPSEVMETLRNSCGNKVRSVCA